MNRLGISAIGCTVAVLLTAAVPPSALAASPSLVTLRNGLRVVLVPDSTATAVDVSVTYGVGIQAEGADVLGASHLIERLMLHGSANVGDGEHVKRITAEGGTTNTRLLLDATAFFETVPAEALGRTLALEADRMAGPRPTAEAFEESRRATVADVRARATRPLVQRAIGRLGMSVYRGTGYERVAEGDEAALARLTPASVEAWRRAHYGASAAVLAIVGRFDGPATLARVRELFESLPAGSPPRAAADRLAAPTPETVIETSSSSLPARLLLVGWRLPGRGDPDAPALDLLAGALSASDDGGFSWALTHRWNIASFAQCGIDHHRDASMLWTMVALAPGADSAGAADHVKDVVGAFRRDPVAADRLERVRARVVTEEGLRGQTVRARAQAIEDSMSDGTGVDGPERRMSALESVTAADLQRAAKRCLGDGACSVVWLLPQGGSR